MITGLRDEIKTALSSIPGLRAYDTVPDNIETPCVFIRPSSGLYDDTAYSGIWMPKFEVTVLASRIGDVGQSQDLLDAYIVPTGSMSVKEAIESGSYAYASDVRVVGFRDYGGLIFGGVTYIGVKFDLDTLV